MKKKIFIIEDNQISFERVKSFLESKNFDVFPVFNNKNKFSSYIGYLRDFLNNIKKDTAKKYITTLFGNISPDIILIDLVLRSSSDNIKDGIEIRNLLLETKKIPYIIFTVAQNNLDSIRFDYNITPPNQIISKYFNNDIEPLSNEYLEKKLLYHINEYFTENTKIVEKFSKIINQYEALINKDEKEVELQLFLEEHPQLIGDYFTKNKDYIPQLHILNSKQLVKDYISDFVLFDERDSGVEIKFVEIEKPNIKLFKSNDDFHHEFNHSVNQLIHWKSELFAAHNVTRMEFELKRINDKIIYKEDYISFLLIAGKTNILNPDKAIDTLWKSRLKTLFSSFKNISFLSYDDILSKSKKRLNAMLNI
ncbi:MAG: hypothetical protein A2046_05940 [Bacteroidetes bacterium GWA2_30_7]|nr:MAG: hypothetical protein A2046_05940 [Bacteroidetes bacterium GWA2_30_7]